MRFIAKPSLFQRTAARNGHASRDKNGSPARGGCPFLFVCPLQSPLSGTFIRPRTRPLITSGLVALLRERVCMSSDPQVLILGGRAAGFFAAVICAAANPHARVTILEKSRTLLSKVGFAPCERRVR